MSRTRIETTTTQKKFHERSRAKFDFHNQRTLEELPSHESVHKVSRYSWDEGAGVTLYGKLERFLTARVGKSADAVYSEFLHSFCAGLSSRWIEEAKNIYKNKFVSDVDRASYRPWRRDFYEDAFGKLQMRVASHVHNNTPKITLIPVPKAKWSDAGIPEVWERVNQVWFRWTCTPTETSYLDAAQTVFARTGWDKEFAHLALAHKRSCSKYEIQHEITPELQRRGI